MGCGEITMKDVFPKLFRTACSKDAYVVENYQLSWKYLWWCVGFVSEASDWEVDLFSSFLNRFYSGQGGRTDDHKMVWSPFRKGVFKVSHFTMCWVPMLGTPPIISPTEVDF